MEKITIKCASDLKIEESFPGASFHNIEAEVNSYSDVSDGYHTIEELYDHRITLYIALCRTISDYAECVAGEWGSGTPEKEEMPWRSKLHHDGTGYDGWFLLGYGYEAGKQITYHVPMSRWEETNFAETFDKSPVTFDGHTSAEVLERLKTL
jgi:hypothetical protein